MPPSGNLKYCPVPLGAYPYVAFFAGIQQRTLALFCLDAMGRGSPTSRRFLGWLGMRTPGNPKHEATVIMERREAKRVVRRILNVR